ncbi:MAG TPA: hypothetical protein VGF55_09185 [Gemmataceae bacterium]|jgi:hypothetical protein
MHPNPDDLSPLERQLAACRPSAAGLDADAMLFAAGRAAARPTAARFVWPAAACGFALLSVMLGTGFVAERSERLALADRLGRMPRPTEAPAPAVAPSPEMSPNSYLAARRLVERDADAWLARRDAPSDAAEPPPTGPVLRAWDTILDQ